MFWVTAKQLKPQSPRSYSRGEKWLLTKCECVLGNNIPRLLKFYFEKKHSNNVIGKCGYYRLNCDHIFPPRIVMKEKERERKYGAGRFGLKFPRNCSRRSVPDRTIHLERQKIEKIYLLQRDQPTNFEALKSWNAWSGRLLVTFI